MTDMTLLQQYLADHDDEDTIAQNLSEYVSGILRQFQVGDVNNVVVEEQVTELVEHVADGIEEATGLRNPVWMVRYHLDVLFGDRQGRDNHYEALMYVCTMIETAQAYKAVTDKEHRPDAPETGVQHGVYVPGKSVDPAASKQAAEARLAEVRKTQPKAEIATRPVVYGDWDIPSFSAAGDDFDGWGEDGW